MPESSSPKSSMSEPLKPETETATDLIELYLDGELDDADVLKVESLAAADPSFAEEIALARRIQSGLRSMGVACPPEVVAAVEQKTEARGWLDALIARVIPASATPWRPALASLGVALALLVAFSGELTRSAPPATDRVEPAPRAATQLASADAEVEAARREVELAFAYLGQLGRTAESSVRRLRTSPQDGDAL